MNKVSLRRYAEPLKRGYCVVTHRPFHGIHGTAPNLPYSRPLPSVWERVCNDTVEPSGTMRASSLPPTRRPGSGSVSSVATGGGGSGFGGSPPRHAGQAKGKPSSDDGRGLYGGHPAQQAPSEISSTAVCCPAPVRTSEGAEVLPIQDSLQGRGGSRGEGAPSAPGPPRPYKAPKSHDGDSHGSESVQSWQKKGGKERKRVVVKSACGTERTDRAHPDGGSERQGSPGASMPPPPPGPHALSHAKHSMPSLSIPRVPTPGGLGGFLAPPAPNLPCSDNGSLYSFPVRN